MEHLNNPDLLTVPEVARQLRVDETTVHRWIQLGVLDAIPLPKCGTRRSYRIKKETLDELLNARSAQTQSSTKKG